VAVQLGYCGLDRRRQPLTGDEIRGCWEAWPAALLPDGAVPLTIGPARPPTDAKQPLAFIEVTAAEPRDANAADAPVGSPGTAATGDAAWSLWGDVEG
jgi:hypothetical protein